MTQHELTMASDPDLRASLLAIKRSAEAARKIAVQTGTAIIIVRDKKIVRISAQELKQEN